MAEALTSIGLETGGVEEVQTIKGGLEGIVIGEDVYKRQCLDCPDEWVKKTSPIRNAIIGLAEKELIPLLNESEKDVYKRQDQFG